MYDPIQAQKLTRDRTYCGPDAVMRLYIHLHISYEVNTIN